MTVQGEATRITLLVTQTLERLGIPYAVGGSAAGRGAFQRVLRG